jgi:hypothetical protein
MLPRKRGISTVTLQGFAACAELQTVEAVGCRRATQRQYAPAWHFVARCWRSLLALARAALLRFALLTLLSWT